MKKSIILITVLFVMGLTIISCGGKSVELSAEMQEFVGMMNGSSDEVVKALAKFGATEDIVNNDMGSWNLKDANVTAKTGDCYTAEFASGATTRIYEICWKDGKISTITEKGMK